MVIHVVLILAVPSIRMVPSSSGVPSSSSGEYTEVQLIGTEEVQAPVSSQENLLAEVQKTGRVTQEVPTKLDVTEPEPAPLKKPDLLAKAQDLQNKNRDTEGKALEDSSEERSSQPSKPLPDLTSLKVTNPERLPEEATRDRISKVGEPTSKETPQLKDPISTVPEQKLQTTLKQPQALPQPQDPAPVPRAPGMPDTLSEAVPLPKEEASSKRPVPESSLTASNPNPVQPEQVDKRPEGEVPLDPTVHKETPIQLKDPMAAIPEQEIKPVLKRPGPAVKSQDPAPPLQAPEMPIALPEQAPLPREADSSKVQIPDLSKPGPVFVQPDQAGQIAKSEVPVEQSAKETPQSKDKTPAKLEDPLLTQEGLKPQRPEPTSEEPIGSLRPPSETIPQVVQKEPAPEQERSKQTQVKQRTVELENKTDLQVRKDDPEVKPGEGDKETPGVKDKVLVLAEQTAPEKLPPSEKNRTSPEEPAPVVQAPVEVSGTNGDQGVPTLAQESSKKRKMVENLQVAPPAVRPEVGAVRESSLPDAVSSPSLTTPKEVPETQDPVALAPPAPTIRKNTSAPPMTSESLPLGEALAYNMGFRTATVPGQGLPSELGSSKSSPVPGLGDLNPAEPQKNSFGVPRPKEEVKREAVRDPKASVLPPPLADPGHKEGLAIPLPKSPPAKFQIQGPAGTREIIFQPNPPKVDIHVEGDVVLKFWILPDGTVGRVIPLKKVDAQLEQAAINYIQKWRFAPLPGNVPQEEEWGIIPIKYKLK